MDKGLSNGKKLAMGWKGPEVLTREDIQCHVFAFCLHSADIGDLKLHLRIFLRQVFSEYFRGKGDQAKADQAEPDQAEVDKAKADKAKAVAFVVVVMIVIVLILFCVC
ncbi:hypothetical protein Tco_0675640 [Tanacetum coccineum]